MTNKIALGDN